MMIMVGWLAFIGSWIMNIAFYKVHPSSVDFSPKRMRERLYIHVLGKKRFLWGYRKANSMEEETSCLGNIGRCFSCCCATTTTCLGNIIRCSFCCTKESRGRLGSTSTYHRRSTGMSSLFTI